MIETNLLVYERRRQKVTETAIVSFKKQQLMSTPSLLSFSANVTLNYSKQPFQSSLANHSVRRHSN